MIGPAVFALIVVVLTVLQYDFMVRLGWAPVGVSDVPWPSALALDPYGFLQVLNFVLFGVMLMVFAAGLQRGVALSGRVSWAGPACLVAAGVALALLGFKTDPHMSTTAAVKIIELECGGCDIGTDRERSVHHDGTHGHPWVKVFDPRCRFTDVRIHRLLS